MAAPSTLTNFFPGQRIWLKFQYVIALGPSSERQKFQVRTNPRSRVTVAQSSSTFEILRDRDFLVLRSQKLLNGTSYGAETWHIYVKDHGELSGATSFAIH